VLPGNPKKRTKGDGKRRPAKNGVCNGEEAIEGGRHRNKRGHPVALSLRKEATGKGELRHDLRSVLSRIYPMPKCQRAKLMRRKESGGGKRGYMRGSRSCLKVAEAKIA